MSPDTIEAVRCAIQSVCETGGTMDELALLEQSDRITELEAENLKLKDKYERCEKALMARLFSECLTCNQYMAYPYEHDSDCPHYATEHSVREGLQSE